MMPVPAMLGASQLVHKPPEAKLLAIHHQPQVTPQHNYQQQQQQQNHMQQHQQQQQQSKPGSWEAAAFLFASSAKLIKKSDRKNEMVSRESLLWKWGQIRKRKT